MRCLFCEGDASRSRGIEHVIPQSLGNTTLTLRPGVVCDGCNNYFAREVERPFLEAGPIVSLRFRQAVPSRRGRVPAATGVLTPDIDVNVERVNDAPYGAVVRSSDPALVPKMLASRRPCVLFDADGDLTSKVVSRFLAKVAVEAMAAKLLTEPALLASFIEDDALDPLRGHARRGIGTWPFNIRRIYREDACWIDQEGSYRQVKWELDFHRTRRGELYLILAVFGLELVLNVGGPAVDGYREWLWANGFASPLYRGKAQPATLVPVDGPRGVASLRVLFTNSRIGPPRRSVGER
jgi:hypothetical protein